MTDYQKYLKYKTKYMNFKQNGGTKPIIIILDFDLTMTDIHSKGMPEIRKNYWQADNKTTLQDKLEEIKRNSIYKLYVVSRGNQTQVDSYVRTNFPGLFKGIYGATEINPISDPDASAVINEKIWSLIKINYIYDIMIQNHLLDKNNILFFDDSELNIDTARQNGFTNSFLIKNGSVGLIQKFNELNSRTLESNLVKEVSEEEASEIQRSREEMLRQERLREEKEERLKEKILREERSREENLIVRELSKLEQNEQESNLIDVMSVLDKKYNGVFFIRKASIELILNEVRQTFKDQKIFAVTIIPRIITVEQGIKYGLFVKKIDNTYQQINTDGTYRNNKIYTSINDIIPDFKYIPI